MNVERICYSPHGGGGATEAEFAVDNIMTSIDVMRPRPSRGDKSRILTTLYIGAGANNRVVVIPELQRSRANASQAFAAFDRYGGKNPKVDLRPLGITDVEIVSLEVGGIDVVQKVATDPGEEHALVFLHTKPALLFDGTPESTNTHPFSFPIETMLQVFRRDTPSAILEFPSLSTHEDRTRLAIVLKDPDREQHLLIVLQQEEDLLGDTFDAWGIAKSCFGKLFDAATRRVGYELPEEKYRPLIAAIEGRTDYATLAKRGYRKTLMQLQALAEFHALARESTRPAELQRLYLSLLEGVTPERAAKNRWRSPAGSLVGILDLIIHDQPRTSVRLTAEQIAATFSSIATETGVRDITKPQNDGGRRASAYLQRLQTLAESTDDVDLLRGVERRLREYRELGYYAKSDESDVCWEIEGIEKSLNLEKRIRHSITQNTAQGNFEYIDELFGDIHQTPRPGQIEECMEIIYDAADRFARDPVVLYELLKRVERYSAIGAGRDFISATTYYGNPIKLRSAKSKILEEMGKLSRFIENKCRKKIRSSGLLFRRK